MQSPEGQSRRDFSVWLRTGRRPRLEDSRKLELKFNPWHDPEDGRFTFRGMGRNYGPLGASQPSGRRQDVPRIVFVKDPHLPPIASREAAERWRAKMLSQHGQKPGYRVAIEEQYRRYLNDIAQASSTSDALGNADHSDGRADGKRTASSRQGGFGSGGGSFGGAGASGNWGNSAEAAAPDSRSAELLISGETAASVPAARSVSAASEPLRTVIRNGYTYKLDAGGRMRRVSGELSNTDTPLRSRTNQAHAGGAERRESDDGGHYIAARFNGPTDAFNHFAQDANFNRGRYRALEDQWAKAMRTGKKVTVTIVPHFHGGAIRPYELDVSFTINGRQHSIKMPNERTEKSRAKR